MLNLRLARPTLLVDIADIPALRIIEDRGERQVVGAAVTHAEIEDGFLGGSGGLLTEVAGAIAYRAVRNRGTIGGSLAHADPAADWLLALTALDASVQIAGNSGRRAAPVEKLARAAFTTVLASDEIIVAVDWAKPSPSARQVHQKISRKVGKFAEAAAAVVLDLQRRVARVAVTRTNGPPLLLPTLGAQLLARPDENVPRDSVLAALEQADGPADGYERQLQVENLSRALARATNS
jgi:carbon-monoxide dehydrogenase medium subunit